MNEANTLNDILGADEAGETLDQAHLRLGHTAPRVTPADIEANIAQETYFTAAEGFAGRYMCMPIVPVMPERLRVLTTCVLTLRNGFLVLGHSEPASTENFDAGLGKRYAREDAVRQVWPLMGYALRQELHIEQLARASMAADERHESGDGR